MQDYRELSQLMERTIHKYEQVEKMKRCYGTGILLSRSEIHTINVIGENPKINVTSLAKIQGVTKGAASQMIYKLLDKKLVEKRVSPNSDTEVCISLTELGRKAYESHLEYHATNEEYFFQKLREVPKEVEEQMIMLLKAFDEALDDRLLHKKDKE